MAKGYAVMCIKIGTEESVIERLRKYPNVVSVEGVYGVHDIIVKLDTGSNDEGNSLLNRIYETKIKSIPENVSSFFVTARSDLYFSKGENESSDNHQN